jgi:DNA-binding CsgD family transcriptional regulator
VEFERLLAAEGMPPELEDLPVSWTVDEPARDGLMRGDPFARRWGYEAARVAADAESARGAFDELAEVLNGERLTRRERAVLTLFERGHGRAAIAARLELTEDAVRWCLDQLRERHGLRFCNLFTNS